MKGMLIVCFLGVAGALTLKSENVVEQAVGNASKDSNWPLPILKPKQHSYFSTNAEGSANFMLKYFSGTKLLSEESFSSSSKVIRVVRYCAREECMNMRFVEDKAAPMPGSKSQEEFVMGSDAEMERVGSAAIDKVKEYSPWIDLHDGIMADGFQVDLAIKDKVKFQKYTMNGPVRINLPYTLFTLELVCCYSEDDGTKLMDYSGVDQPEKCRTNKDCLDNVEPKQSPLTWYKVTYAAPDPVAAAEFSVRALGAVRKANPFEDNMGPDCTSAQWVVIPDQDYGLTEKEADEPIMPVHDCTIENKNGDPIKGLSLHFVANPSYSQGNVTIEDLAKHQGELVSKNLESDIFDQYLHNHVEFQTESLDPFIARFKSIGLAFITRKNKDSFAVYVTEPKNGLLFKITSTKAPTLVNAQRADEY